jgi:hypothetical protein
MRRSGLSVVMGALLVASLSACSRQQTAAVDCKTDSRYSVARSAPPVQVPDDLSPPSESDALRLPSEAAIAAAAAPAASGSCLESPPSFFGDARPFRRSASADEPVPEPAEQAQPPAAGGDRVIDN